MFETSLSMGTQVLHVQKKCILPVHCLVESFSSCKTKVQRMSPSR